MAEGKFVVKKITNMLDLSEGAEIPESDFSLLVEDRFVQFKLELPPDEDTRYVVNPGVYTVAMNAQDNFELKKTSFLSEPILESYVQTKEVSSKISKFFNKLDVYKDYGLFPKRGMLLWGSAGTGKSLAISMVCRKFVEEGKTTVILWATDKFRPQDIKDFFKNFKYESTERLILVMEDLGGVEIEGQQMPSMSSLLSLMDNIEQTFTIPTMMVATTNFPENFLENLTNRPQRFDDVIEVKRPDPSIRPEFLTFFSKGKASEDDLNKIKDKKYNDLSIAHLKEIVIRSAIYDLTLSESIDQIYVQSVKAKKNFAKDKASMGFNSSDD